jgi:hypothetical protein
MDVLKVKRVDVEDRNGGGGPLLGLLKKGQIQ